MSSEEVSLGTPRATSERGEIRAMLLAWSVRGSAIPHGKRAIINAMIEKCIVGSMIYEVGKNLGLVVEEEKVMGVVIAEEAGMGCLYPSRMASQTQPEFHPFVRRQQSVETEAV